MSLTKQKGDVAEAYVTYLLKQKGFNVLIPWGEDNRFDLVAEKNVSMASNYEARFDFFER